GLSTYRPRSPRTAGGSVDSGGPCETRLHRGMLRRTYAVVAEVSGPSASTGPLPQDGEDLHRQGGAGLELVPEQRGPSDLAHPERGRRDVQAFSLHGVLSPAAPHGTQALLGDARHPGTREGHPRPAEASAPVAGPRAGGRGEAREGGGRLAPAGDRGVVRDVPRPPAGGDRHRPVVPIRRVLHLVHGDREARL